MAASLVAGATPSEQVERVSRVYSAYAGRELVLTERIFASSSSPGIATGRSATLHVARGAHSAIRDSYDILEAPSSLQRPAADCRVLERHGRKARIYELQGDLLFAGVESVVREISELGGELELLVLDVRRISDVADVSHRLLVDLGAFLRKQGCEKFLVDPDGRLADPGSDGEEASPAFSTVADATMFCEERLIERYGERQPAEEEFELTDHPALTNVSDRIVDELRRRMRWRSFADGEPIVAEGDAQAGVFLIMCGRVRSSLTTAAGTKRSIATLTPATCFGDVYVVTGNPHPLSMHADGPAELYELTREEFARIGEEDPELRAALVNGFMFAIHDDLDRSLRALANGRVARTTAS